MLFLQIVLGYLFMGLVSYAMFSTFFKSTLKGLTEFCLREDKMKYVKKEDWLEDDQAPKVVFFSILIAWPMILMVAYVGGFKDVS